MKKAAVTLRLPPELLERVEALAQAERRPLQNLLRNLIDDGIAAQQGRTASSEQVAACMTDPSPDAFIVVANLLAVIGDQACRQAHERAASSDRAGRGLHGQARR